MLIPFIAIHCDLHSQRVIGMPMRGHLPAPAMRPRRASATDDAWSRFVGGITNPEFVVLVCICGLGLLISICFMQFMPEYGAIVESLTP